MRSAPLPDLFGRPLTAAEKGNAPARLWTAGDEGLLRRGVRVAVTEAAPPQQEGSVALAGSPASSSPRASSS